MPLFTLIGLILSVIKIALDVAAYLRAHPDTTSEVKSVLDRAHFTLNEVHTELSEWEKTHDPESA